MAANLVAEEAPPRVLILTPVKDAVPHLAWYLDRLEALCWPRDRLSIGFLESDSRDGTFEVLGHLRPALERRFAAVSIWKRDFGFRHRVPRWHPSIQRQRRSVLACSRNELLRRTLTEADEVVLWIDVDMVSWPPDLIQKLLAARREIVVPHVVRAGTAETFDLNTWRLHPEYRAFDWSPWMIDGILQPPRGLGRQYLGELTNDEIVEVDAVGGCVLFVRAKVHRAGVVFPESPVEGLIETEGLAVLAREKGFGCFGLPRLSVSHT